MLSDDLRKTIEEQIKKDRIVIYMKGNPQMPQCGFSAAVIQAVSKYGKPFRSYDILQDEMLRQGIKEFSNWPTIPQVYINGKFVGGCDIVMDLEKKGELENML
jgi:monothiol glutaredoxin